jgi:hypothetical protein
MEPVASPSKACTQLNFRCRTNYRRSILLSAYDPTDKQFIRSTSSRRVGYGPRAVLNSKIYSSHGRKCISWSIGSTRGRRQSCPLRRGHLLVEYGSVGPRSGLSLGYYPGRPSLGCGRKPIGCDDAHNYIGADYRLYAHPEFALRGSQRTIRIRNNL